MMRSASRAAWRRAVLRGRLLRRGCAARRAGPRPAESRSARSAGSRRPSGRRRRAPPRPGRGGRRRRTPSRPGSRRTTRSALDADNNFASVAAALPASADQRDIGEERRLGDADLRVGGRHLALGGGDVGAPFEQGRRQPRRDRRAARAPFPTGAIVSSAGGLPISTAIACSSCARSHADRDRLGPRALQLGARPAPHRRPRRSRHCTGSG